ncbi:cellulose synthase (UDP-forming) [Natronocella acetinitrilica]|uniref:Cellulose synthase catalytic subunit [UDP-forming] n=1 Tax=Natronocella acetinitrilica TaxID=414046 RepID=A0AAE3G3N1_9GAMM|nr:UDP-forming cellulose synthase catalytic subunit [Natronocella acetinitrilica]MCP1674474.1 cellulose synthase (UDP-forming) [Natronocella acetinitrilica]
MRLLSRALIALGALVLAGVLALFMAQPLSLAAQSVFAASALGVVGVLYLVRPRGFLRVVMLLVVTLVVGRYLVWRTTHTLPPSEDPLALALGLTLYLAEAYTILMLALNFFVISDPIRRKTPALPERCADWPSVDVYIPTYNESPELVSHTLRAAAALDYPAEKLRVYLLDDGGTTQKLTDADPARAEQAAERARALRALCARTGATYLSRERNTQAKAGNLNAAFMHTTGDLIAVFDCDHVPTREFLLKTVGHFVRDPKCFLVQTPHAFITPDPLERNLGLAGRSPGENEMFYSLVQNGLDRWGASFFCGSAAVLSRAALNDSGGFCGKSVTEDAETAITLHARGWRSCYVDEPLITGLQPETFSGFVGQRSRWLQGMIQIFIYKNPILTRGLTFAQRLCYLAIQLYWLFPLPRLVFFAAPLVFLFFGVSIYMASIEEFIAYALPYLVAVITLAHASYGHLRRPFISDLYEAVQSVYLLRALGGVLLRPWAPHFNVTDKGETLARDDLSPLIRTFVVLPVLLIGGMVAALISAITNPDTAPVLLLVCAFNAFNLVLALAALGVMCERRQRRRYPRLPVAIAVRARLDGRTLDAEVRDISVTGVNLVVDEEIARVGESHVQIEINEASVPVRLIDRTPVRGGTRLRGEVDTDCERELAAWSSLMYGSNTHIKRYLDSKRRYRSAFIGTLQFLGLALTGLYALLRVLTLRGLEERRRERATRRSPQTETL